MTCTFGVILRTHLPKNLSKNQVQYHCIFFQSICHELLKNCYKTGLQSNNNWIIFQSL